METLVFNAIKKLIKQAGKESGEIAFESEDYRRTQRSYYQIVTLARLSRILSWRESKKGVSART